MYPRSGLPLVSLSIIGSCVAIYGLLYGLGWYDPRVLWLGIASFQLSPGDRFVPWQLLTYAFLHASTAHLVINMLGLWMFGREIEQRWGRGKFALYYLICIVGAGVSQLAFAAVAHSNAPTVGASGGVFGILLAFAINFPERKILLLIPPIPMKAKYVAIGIGLLELGFGLTGTFSSIAHFAHLGGMLFGGIALLVFRRYRGVLCRG